MTILINRISPPALYPNPNYVILAAVPAIHTLGLSSILFEIRYTLPSTGSYARDATVSSLGVVGQLVYDYGYRDLKASIKIGGRNVGTVVGTSDTHPLIPRKVQPPFIFIPSYAGTFAIQITTSGSPYTGPTDAIFDAARNAFNLQHSKPPTAVFGSVQGQADFGEKLGIFDMKAKEGVSGGLNNAKAATVAGAFVKMLNDIALIGELEFEVFETPEYRVVASGQIWMDDEEQAHARLNEKPGANDTATA